MKNVLARTSFATSPFRCGCTWLIHFYCSRKQKRNIRYFFRLHARITVKEKKKLLTLVLLSRRYPWVRLYFVLNKKKLSSVFRPVWPISIHVYTYLCDDTLGRGCKFNEHGMQFVNFCTSLLKCFYT
jgi:hypothetical protein